MPKRPPPFLWSLLIRDHGPDDPTLKLCLYTIRTFMDAGGDAWPSQTTIAKAASLTDRIVRSKLKKAVRLRWLSVMVAGFTGHGWRRHGYQTCIPDGVPLTDEQERLTDLQQAREGSPDQDAERADVIAAARGKRAERGSGPSPKKPPNVRNVVPKRAERSAATCGTSTQNVRNHVPTNSVLKYSMKYSLEGRALTRSTPRVKNANDRKPDPGTQSEPMAADLIASGLSSIAPEVSRGQTEPTPKRDLSAAIRRLIAAGESPDAVQKILSGQGCTLHDIREAMT